MGKLVSASQTEPAGKSAVRYVNSVPVLIRERLVLMRSSPSFGDSFCQKSGKTAICRGLVNTTAGLLSVMLGSPCGEVRIAGAPGGTRPKPPRWGEVLEPRHPRLREACV
jgi:hypothetical protein